MKHKTALMLAAVGWTLAGAARAQTAPEPPTQAPPTPGPQTAPTDDLTAQTAPAPASTAPSAPVPAAVPASPVAPAPPAAVDTSGSPNPRPLLGLGLAAPDTGALPGRFRPSFGVAPTSAGDYKFDFHGFLVLPLRLGVNERAHPTSTQYKTVYHGPPLVPDDFDRFEHTGVVPGSGWQARQVRPDRGGQLSGEVGVENGLSQHRVDASPSLSAKLRPFGMRSRSGVVAEMVFPA